MERLDCPRQNFTMNSLGTTAVIDGKMVAGYTCQCGQFTSASARVAQLILDQINGGLLMEMPVFADPLYLSVEVSIGIVVVVGKLGSILATTIYLPPIIGFLLAGMAIQVNIALFSALYFNI